MDIYEVLSHPIRRRLLLLLERDGYLKHSELMDKLAIDKTGILNFHLKQLEELVSKEPKTKAYYLSEMGKAVIRIIDLNERLLKGEELPAEAIKKGEISRVGVITCNCTGKMSGKPPAARWAAAVVPRGIDGRMVLMAHRCRPAMNRS
ncbi:MAG: hypothetical protein Q6365_015700 [Candidatus Sigynarchaeota archaeon]